MHRIIGCALCLLTGCSTVAADPPATSDPVTHYDPNPAHLWNRLHAALRTRPDRDGKAIGHDTLDPVVFPTTKRLLEGPSHAEAVKLLDEFLADGHTLVREPVKRAVMQRDMWAVFDWAAYPFGNFYNDRIETRSGPLQQRLAKAIRKLAPSKAEAEALPDTYALAVQSKSSTAICRVSIPQTTINLRPSMEIHCTCITSKLSPKTSTQSAECIPELSV